MSPSGRPSRQKSPDRSFTLAGFATALDKGPTPGWVWRPLLVELEPEEAPGLRAFCRDRGIKLVDEIRGQIAELATVRRPREGADGGRREFLETLLEEQGGRTESYGTWAYFPWERKMVHLLPREDFFDVITSRNQDKITRGEQLRLRAKSVGIVGLSVGAEIAVTLAQEHLCGLIRLADFDSLELSNLNRLSAGIDDLGVNKAHLAARRIAKIDPFLEVEVFDQGVSPGNEDVFLHGLDLLVEECDDLVTKYHLRERARELGLNVVFAADERGMLSVEPYAHAPDLAPFHGRIPHPPQARETFSSQGAFMRSLVDWLGGWDNISERSGGSVEKIGESLCGYPQLASEPRLAAGMVGPAARRLLLGEELPPLFGYLDLDQEMGRLLDSPHPASIAGTTTASSPSTRP